MSRTLMGIAAVSGLTLLLGLGFLQLKAESALLVGAVLSAAGGLGIVGCMIALPLTWLWRDLKAEKAEIDKIKRDHWEIIETTYSIVLAFLMVAFIAYLPYYAFGELTGWWEPVSLIHVISTLVEFIFGPHKS